MSTRRHLGIGGMNECIELYFDTDTDGVDEWGEPIEKFEKAREVFGSVMWLDTIEKYDTNIDLEIEQLRVTIHYDIELNTCNEIGLRGQRYRVDKIKHVGNEHYSYIFARSYR